MTEKYQYFNGLKFTRDEKTGYYLNSTIRMRMHRYVWEYYNGPIPDGYCVHHIDHDKGNNDISNLSLMKLEEHSSLHGRELAEASYDEMIKNLDEHARPKANEWHGSEAGKAWHKQHYEETKDRLHAQNEFVCVHCGKRFIGKKANSKFCSSKCRAAARRKSGADDVIRKCVICGKEFKANKYSKIQTCSASCGSTLAYSHREKRGA